MTVTRPEEPELRIVEGPTLRVSPSAPAASPPSSAQCSSSADDARKRPGNAGALRTRILTHLDQVESILPAWADLYAHSDLGNPNLHPAWVGAWYRTFVPPADVVVVAVESGDDLVGVAPFWRYRLLPGSRRFTTLQQAGAGRHVLLSDSPGLLTATGAHRRITKAALDALATEPEWAWCTLSLSPQQGWSDQLIEPGITYAVPRVGRTYVVSALPTDISTFEKQLKRNVRESLRRSVNRLNKAGEPWSVDRVPATSPRFREAVSDVVRLHRCRAQLDGHKNHGDVFADDRYERFLLAAATLPGGGDLMDAYLLRLGGELLAAQLVMHSPTTTMLLTSGLHRDGWHYSPMAVITRQIVRDCVAAGRKRLNHSAGPDTGKLRWSEAMETHPEFSLVRAGLPARAAFLAHSHLAVHASAHRERLRQHHRPAKADDA